MRPLALLLVLIPAVASAQDAARADVSLVIPGFAEATTEVETVRFSGDSVEVSGSLVYETNRPDQTVYVHVDGDLTGLELRVEPADARVRGMALSGSTGDAGSVSVRSAGSFPLVTNVTGAGVEMDVRYTVVAINPRAASRARDVRIYYTIN